MFSCLQNSPFLYSPSKEKTTKNSWFTNINIYIFCIRFLFFILEFFVLRLLLVRIVKELLMPLITPIVLTILCCQLWKIYNDCLRDPNCKMPLPPGGYGFPLFGETLGFLIQVKYFNSMHIYNPYWIKIFN